MSVFGNDAINSHAVVRSCPPDVEPNPWPQNHTPFFIRAANTPPLHFCCPCSEMTPSSHIATQPRSYSHSSTAPQTHSHAHSHPATQPQINSHADPLPCHTATSPRRHAATVTRAQSRSLNLT